MEDTISAKVWANRLLRLITEGHNPNQVLEGYANLRIDRPTYPSVAEVREELLILLKLKE